MFVHTAKPLPRPGWTVPVGSPGLIPHMGPRDHRKVHRTTVAHSFNKRCYIFVFQTRGFWFFEKSQTTTGQEQKPFKVGNRLNLNGKLCVDEFGTSGDWGESHFPRRRRKQKSHNFHDVGATINA